MPHDFKTVLCPTDFSAESYRAADYGARLAHLYGGTLLLAHVLHNPTSEFFHPEGYVLSFDQARQRAETLLQELRDQRLGASVPCRLLVDVGDPYERLMAMVREHHVDLVVTATHGRSGLQHLVLGSVAEKIIRHAPCPVLVIRRGVD